MSDDPTRRESARRPIDAPPVAPAVGAVTFGEIAASGDVLCVECKSCNRRTALTKAECPALRVGNGRFVLHATFRCRCGASDARLYQATTDEAAMFLAGDPLRRRIG